MLLNELYKYHYFGRRNRHVIELEQEVDDIKKRLNDLTEIEVVFNFEDDVQVFYKGTLDDGVVESRNFRSSLDVINEEWSVKVPGSRKSGKLTLPGILAYRNFLLKEMYLLRQ